MLKEFWRWKWISLALAIVLMSTVVATPSMQAQTETLLHSFRNWPDGANPQAGLIRDAAGNFYGTTYYGGMKHGCTGHGCGVVFKVGKAGKETVLYTFTGPDGGLPMGGLVRDKPGNLYGTTSAGGASDLGTVFKLDPSGHETVLHSFTGPPDGENPFAGLVLDPRGNLYGTTEGGGIGTCCGTVFKVDTTGKETVVYTFTGGADGGGPFGGLIRDKASNLYGTTFGGGTSDLGIVFKVTPNGTETVLYSFVGGTDGQFPAAGVIMDSAGNLYGTTKNGGNPTVCNGFGCGTVFKLAKNGTETVLYSFSGGADGSAPLAGVIRDTAGNLYGTTVGGGNLSCGSGSGCGTVFKVDTTGKETVLHSFAGNHGDPRDGDEPSAGLTRDAAGNLYGTTSSGGKYQNFNFNVGTVFKLSP